MLHNKTDLNSVERDLQSAIDHQQVSRVKKLLKKGKGKRLNTACFKINGINGGFLHLAAKEGNTQIVKCLVEAGADLFIKDSRGNTSIVWAIVHQHKQVVEYLGKKDPNLSTLKTGNGLNMLQLAASTGYLEIVQFLVEQTPSFMSIEDEQGDCSSIKIAITQGHLAIVRYMLVQLKCVSLLPEGYEASLCQLAIESRHLNIVKYFIKIVGIDPFALKISRIEPATVKVAQFVLKISRTVPGEDKITQYLAEQTVLKIAEKGLDSKNALNQDFSSLCKIYYENLIDRFCLIASQHPNPPVFLKLLTELKIQLSLCPIRVQALVLVALNEYLHNKSVGLHNYLTGCLAPLSENRWSFMRRYSDLHLPAAGELAMPRRRRVNEGMGYWIYRFLWQTSNAPIVSEEEAQERDFIQRELALINFKPAYPTGD